MLSPRTLLVLATGVTAITAAAEQGSGLRWPSLSNGSLGLSVATHSAPHGPTVNLVGKASLGSGLGLYGRLGSFQGRPWALPGGSPLDTSEGGHSLAYGVGMSWDVTPRLSATLGWDTYDLRAAGGERGLRFTNIGLQWRY
jgi:OOP family OmpA-OmpF porin